MRQKAEKLEKGKWYADVSRIDAKLPSFLKYSHSENDNAFFSELKEHDSYGYVDGFIPFFDGSDWFIPTKEDREKHNLIDENKLKLGDRITISKRLYRRSKEIAGINCVDKYIPNHTYKYWATDISRGSTEVMIIGKRILKNGTVEYHNDIGSVFTSTESIQAYLVVKDMNTKPFYVLIDE